MKIDVIRKEDIVKKKNSFYHCVIVNLLFSYSMHIHVRSMYLILSITNMYHILLSPASGIVMARNCVKRDTEPAYGT